MLINEYQCKQFLLLLLLSFLIIYWKIAVSYYSPNYIILTTYQFLKFGFYLGEEETQIAFEKHFAEELNIYHSQVIVNLMEQTGKEKIINDAYLNHILEFSCPDLIYVSFDFHEYW